jgi:meso-butanediol dehydrogenase/(S,S)-butanediol dehydrogenase/diacetyl reductase
VTNFIGKVALVTGTSGIGRASARRLAAGGAHVLALGIDPASNAEFDRLAREDGLTMAARLCDASEDAQVAGAVAACVGKHGRLDIIVNAAAIHPSGTV